MARHVTHVSFRVHSNEIMKRLPFNIKALLIFLFLIASTNPNSMAQAAGPIQRTISVSGEGKLFVVPDKATVRFGIVSRHDDPEEARRQNAETSRDAMNAVRELGIEERKLRLESLRLQPVREYNPQTRRPEDKGFEASRELVVEIEDLEVLPVLISQIVQKGANRLNGVNYGLKDRDQVRDEALQLAVTRARDKARLMVQTLDVALGEVLSIQEQSFSMPMPRMRMADQPMMMAKAEAAAPEPAAYAAGEVEVSAVVQVSFFLK